MRSIMGESASLIRTGQSIRNSNAGATLARESRFFCVVTKDRRTTCTYPYRTTHSHHRQFSPRTASPEPPPQNVLTIEVYTHHTKIIDNGELITSLR